MSNLTKRVITAFGMLLVALFAIFVKGWEILVLIMSGVGMFEFLTLNNFKNIIFKFLIIVAVLLSSYYLFALSIHTPLLGLILIAITLLFWLKNIVFVISYPKYQPSVRTINVLLNLYFYFMPMIFILIILGSKNKSLLILLLLIVWGADIFAYFAGRAFGKHKLTPKLSSGKTIEGVIGGLVGVMIITVVWMFITDNLAWQYLIITLVAAMASVIGDLTQSIYKRSAEVKDSGNILPGHGGVLDRIDSILAAAPIFTILSMILL